MFEEAIIIRSPKKLRFLGLHVFVSSEEFKEDKQDPPVPKTLLYTCSSRNSKKLF